MIYKGIFWLIEGELYTNKLECDKSGNVIGDGSGLNSKSGDNFNHRLTWEGLPKNVTHGKEYNYYPRGRVEIKGGKDGILIPIKDEKAIANAINTLYHDYDGYIRMAQASFNSVEKYDLNKYKCSILEIFSSVIHI